MAKRFDPANWTKLEDPQRLVELPPSIIIDLLELRGDETLADFGAGTGMYSLSLAAAVPRGRVYAIEEQQPLLHRLQIKLDDQLEPGARITPVLTDGPYLESKEVIGGFWVIDAPDLDVALRLAAAGSNVTFAAPHEMLAPALDSTLSAAAEAEPPRPLR